MRIINKKYLLIILLVGVILTGVIVAKPNKEVKLDNVVLKQEVNNKTFAMYKEDGENNYVKVEDNKFPDMYVLNLTESKCIDNNGNELDGVLSYENDKVTITSGNTTYCYLYFDKSLGLEIKEKKPTKLSEDVKGAMYRFQGPAKDESGKELVNNYICFGTDNKEECIANQDKHMYRIIGIEAETGRVKVIKKEALEQAYKWWDNIDEDIAFPKSNIYKEISGASFLENKNYVPEGWENKISDNTWTYGNMLSDGTLGANQPAEGLYKTETGQKETRWYNWADKDTPDAIQTTVGYEDSPYKNRVVYYTNESGYWTKTFESKVSLMYLHDYYYSVSDEANCQRESGKYQDCKTSWMHLSQNDQGAPDTYEWTMSSRGWSGWDGYFCGRIVIDSGATTTSRLSTRFSVRPVFFINASEELLDGLGTITNPFLIKE